MKVYSTNGTRWSAPGLLTADFSIQFGGVHLGGSHLGGGHLGGGRCGRVHGHGDQIGGHQHEAVSNNAASELEASTVRQYTSP